MKTTFNSKRRVLAAAFALALAAPLAPAIAAGWPAGDVVQGNGTIRKQAYQVPHFSGVALAVPGKLELRIGNQESVTIEADENLLPLIVAEVKDGTLRIAPAKKNLRLNSSHLKAVVTARAIDKLIVGGSGSIEADPLRGSRIELVLGGSGSINVKGIESESLAVVVGGSGELQVGGGNARTLSVSIGGSGDVDLARVRASSVNVNIGGSGTATVWARDSLNMTGAGSGDVNYYGDPAVSRSVLGSGSARRLGGAPR